MVFLPNVFFFANRYEFRKSTSYGTVAAPGVVAEEDQDERLNKPNNDKGARHHEQDEEEEKEGDARLEKEDKDEEDDNPDALLPSLTAEFQSIDNQKVIQRCMVYLIIYFVVAVLAFSFVFENWTIVDSIYFAVNTFTTCGYGDKQPTTAAGQLFTIVFATYGVIILGIMLGMLGHAISEAQTKAMEKLRSKRRGQLLELLFGCSIDPNGSVRDGLFYEHMTLAEDIWFVVRREIVPILAVVIAALFLGIWQQWPLTSTLYFCIMSVTTTGYGDYVPKSQAGKVYCIFFLPLAVAVFGEFLGRIASIFIRRKRRSAERKFLHRALTLADLRKMDYDSDGLVNREEFITFMLVALEKVDQESIDELRTLFHALDTNGSGFLDRDDLLCVTQRNLASLRESDWARIPGFLPQDRSLPSLDSTNLLSSHRRTKTTPW